MRQPSWKIRNAAAWSSFDQPGRALSGSTSFRGIGGAWTGGAGGGAGGSGDSGGGRVALNGMSRRHARGEREAEPEQRKMAKPPEAGQASASSTRTSVQLGSRLESRRSKVQTSAVRRSSTASPSGPLDRLRNSARKRTRTRATSPSTSLPSISVRGACVNSTTSLRPSASRVSMDFSKAGHHRSARPACAGHRGRRWRRRGRSSHRRSGRPGRSDPDRSWDPWPRCRRRQGPRGGSSTAGRWASASSGARDGCGWGSPSPGWRPTRRPSTA